MNLVVFVWGLGCFFIGKSTSPAESYLWWRIAVVGGLFIAPFFYHTTCIFAMVRQPVRLVASYIQASLFAILSLFTDVTLNKLRLLSGVAYYPTGNLMFFIMFLCWTTVILFGTKVLINLLKKSTGKLHLQTKYLIIAFLTGFIGGGATLFPVFDLPYSFIYPFGNFGVALYSIIGTYAILRHKLMDISLVVQKGFIYSVLITLITTIYLLSVLLAERILFRFAGYTSIVASILAAFTIALLFTPLKNTIQNFIDKRFFKGTLSSLAEEKQRLEEELRRSERLKAVATLAAGMAHEIKNPLTSIKTFTEYLERNKNKPEFIAKFKKIVSSEVDRIDNIVHQLLDFAKPTPLKLKPCDIHQLLDETLLLLSNDLLKHKIKLIREYNTLNSQLKADFNQLKQAFLNIFLNAIEAMPNGGILTVTINQQNNELIVAIKDMGKGISKESLLHIFDPFFTTSSKGTGLGLSITHGIIKEHGGRIKIESKLGIGSEVEIRLIMQQATQL